MASIQSLGTISTTNPWRTWSAQRSSVRMYDATPRAYAALYREQPNVRVCVDFLARNIAQLGLHFFRRVDDSNRERLDNSFAPVALINRPLPPQYKITRYHLIESIVSDLGVYWNAYLLKLANGSTNALLRIPPIYMEVAGGLVGTGYKMTIGGKVWDFTPDEIIHFRGYNPENPLVGLSPLETLRRVLAEEDAMGEYREGFWQNAARISGVVERPAAAPEWSDIARERFRLEFEELYSGKAKSGKTAVLEEGMTWRPITFNAQESEYLGGRKLTREECARAYHIPPPLVGILDHATFSNIQEQHKHLYMDTLGPILAMLEQDIQLQLLPEFDPAGAVYCEFNINEKLQGDFAEQTRSLQSAVGRPWMTADEARARLNMPLLGGDAGQLVTPLNVLMGGQASPRDSAPPPKQLERKARAISSHHPELRARHQRMWENALTRHYQRQEKAVKSAMGSKAMIGADIWFDLERWNRELSDDLYQLNTETATTWATIIASAAGADISERRMENWLREHSRVQAENINQFTFDQLAAADTDPERATAIDNVFKAALSFWVARQATSAITAAISFGGNEGASAGGLTKKTWRVNSGNPRDSHAALNGQTVGLRETFANGLRWPGDPRGSADDNAGCECSVDFS
jgi:HK97 family phage portal protein